jgi:hypothetical protein
MICRKSAATKVGIEHIEQEARTPLVSRATPGGGVEAQRHGDQPGEQQGDARHEKRGADSFADERGHRLLAGERPTQIAAGQIAEPGGVANIPGRFFVDPVDLLEPLLILGGELTAGINLTELYRERRARHVAGQPVDDKRDRQKCDDSEKKPTDEIRGHGSLAWHPEAAKAR